MVCFYPGVTCSECISNIAQQQFGAAPYDPVPEAIYHGTCDNPPPQYGGGYVIPEPLASVMRDLLGIDDKTIETCRQMYSEPGPFIGKPCERYDSVRSFQVDSDASLNVIEIRKFVGVDGTILYVRGS
jgi:hypothetical protein